MDKKLIEEVFLNYSKKGIEYPASKKIIYPDAYKFDDLIAVWCDYFNNKLSLSTKIEPDMVKALMVSESSFNPLAKNKNALGLTQVTKDTLKILQDLDGEVKDFVFKDIKQKDLKDPNVSVALGVRWLAQKQRLASSKLKREPTSDEVVMMYKGILNDRSKTASKIMEDYRGIYAKLKK